MNNDLISREALKNKIKELPWTGDESYYDRVGLHAITDLIDNAPTVEPLKIYEFKGCNNCELERPQGEWIMIKNSDGHLKCYECSECKKSQGYISNFCEDCGADMRGDAE